MEENQSILGNALKQLEIATEKLNIESGIHEILKHPKKTLTVSIVVKMDDGTIEPSAVVEFNITMPEDRLKVA